jgi:hypothetical protein
MGNKEQNLGYNMDFPSGNDLNFNLCEAQGAKKSPSLA